MHNREETMDTICGCIAQGKSLVQILTAEGMPTYTTVMRWLQEKPELREMYTRAREDQADYLADEIIAIADGEPDPQVARVRVDARKWVASKLKPRKYGDKVTQEITGKDGGPVEFNDVQRAARLAAILNAARTRGSGSASGSGSGEMGSASGSTD